LILMIAKVQAKTTACDHNTAKLACDVKNK